MPQALSDILAQLDPVYAPQKQVVNQQLAALPGQQQGELAGLDQAKNNAFDQINVQANDRGMSYSGLPIAEQAKYTGATYLPDVANLKNTYANKGFALQGILAQLEADRMKQGQGVYNDQLKAEQDAAAKVQAAKEAAQARIQAAQIAASSRASNQKAPDPAKGYSLSRDSVGGLAFTGPNHRPATAAQYANVTGTSIRDLLSSSGNDKDAKIIKEIDSGASWAALAKKYPEVFGGV